MHCHLHANVVFGVVARRESGSYPEFTLRAVIVAPYGSIVRFCLPFNSSAITHDLHLDIIDVFICSNRLMIYDVYNFDFEMIFGRIGHRLSRSETC